MLRFRRDAKPRREGPDEGIGSELEGVADGLATSTAFERRRVNSANCSSLKATRYIP